MATGIVGWSPERFWRSTPHEFWAAWETWRIANKVPEED
jgi:hypothetical protein